MDHPLHGPYSQNNVLDTSDVANEAIELGGLLLLVSHDFLHKLFQVKSCIGEWTKYTKYTKQDTK